MFFYFASNVLLRFNVRKKKKIVRILPTPDMSSDLVVSDVLIEWIARLSGSFDCFPITNFDRRRRRMTRSGVQRVQPRADEQKNDDDVECPW